MMGKKSNGKRNMTIELEEMKSRLRAITGKLHAYEHAMGVMYYDAATGAPRGGAEDRGKTLAVLSEVVYGLQTGEETGEFLHALDGRKDELDLITRREVTVLLRDYERTKKIPLEEYVAYQVLLNEADAVWHRAKTESDWPAFEPYMEKIVAFNRKLAGWLDPEKKPYDALLDQYERGLTMEKLDGFFGVLKERLVPLILRIAREGRQPRDIFAGKEFPAEGQRQLSDWLMAAIGIDREYCSIGETEHPFTTGWSKHDVRITTHYHTEEPLSSLYSVVHEGGHALYELNVADELQGTVLAGGASMSIHECQSRFFENIIGRSRGFVRNLLPELRRLFPEQMEGVTEEELYRAANVSRPSLIRTEADELTYSLHVLLRYELEKKLVDGSLAVHDLPAAWNAKMKEYLGLDVPDDQRGVLQDSHWSGGAIGYFPSYALGSAYGAQILALMRETVDVDAVIASGDLEPIRAWLTERVWSKGSLYDPLEIFEQATGAPFDPAYYTDYLTKKYSEIYGF